MLRISLSLLLTLLLFRAISQENNIKARLYNLDERITQGDSNALKTIGGYIDDTTFVQEFLGYHNWPNKARNIALRIIKENCLFDTDQLLIDSSITSEEFLNLFKRNRIIFDDTSTSFLITPLSLRKTQYEIKELSDFDLSEIDSSLKETAFSTWYTDNQIDWLIKRKNPDVLMWIASAWFQKRTRFNKYYFNDEEFLGLIKKLTHKDIGVPDEAGSITYFYKYDFNSVAKLNYLIYWVNHRNDYKWNAEKGFFENVVEKGVKKTKEEMLFGLLQSKNDSIAMDAFVQLAELNISNVTNLARVYEQNHIDANFSIPIFPYRFLMQMVLLTQYCRAEDIKYKPNGWLKDSLQKLKTDMSFKERYQFENRLIEKLTPDEITMVEYFGLVNERDWSSTYSIGRIIDKFYSKKWRQAVIDRPKYLKAYLKKSKLFDELGIIGNCNKYLKKFENADETIIEKVRYLRNDSDADIKVQAEKVLTVPDKKKVISKKVTENFGTGVVNLKAKYAEILKSKKKHDDKKYGIEKLFGAISFQQLGESIEILKKDRLLTDYEKYNIINSDFGFPINVNSLPEIKLFLERYKAYNEYGLYKKYLDETGMNYQDENGKLNYNGIYEILKYDVVDAFVGGGGGRQDDGVYLVIKILELTFKTSLGFSKKSCSWQGYRGCDRSVQAATWMKFLIDHNLATPDKFEPVSISGD